MEFVLKFINKENQPENSSTKVPSSVKSQKTHGAILAGGAGTAGCSPILKKSHTFFLEKIEKNRISKGKIIRGNRAGLFEQVTKPKKVSVNVRTKYFIRFMIQI